MAAEKGATTTAVEQIEKIVPPIRHAGGWAPDKALCGAVVVPSPMPKKPTKPECVVCWSIWCGMSHPERLALWARHGRPNV